MFTISNLTLKDSLAAQLFQNGLCVTIHEFITMDHTLFGSYLGNSSELLQYVKSFYKETFDPKDPKAENLDIEKIPDLIAFYYKQKEGTAVDPAARALSIMNRYLNFKLTIPPAFPVEMKFDIACKVLTKLKPFHATGGKEISRVGTDPPRLRL